MFSFLIFVLTVLILVGVHEAGHFIAAKLMHVKVLRFSIGFGKPLFSWKGNGGTEYVLAWLPLGGYVRLLNSREDKVEPADYSMAFDHQAIWRRVVIVLAGPFINLVFAFIIFSLVFTIGIDTIKPVIEKIIPSSIADQSNLKPGLQITHVRGKKVHDWEEVFFQLLFQIGNPGILKLNAKPFPEGPLQSFNLNIDTWKLDALNPDILKSLGIVPYRPKSSQWPINMKYQHKFAFYDAFLPALKKTFLFLQINAVILEKIFLGKISFQNLGGPLLIYKVANIAFKQGFVIFLNFLGVVSVMLAFMNLLPIPSLDGSQLLYCAIEKMRGKPLSVPLEALLVRLGMIVLIVLIIHVTLNDILRFSMNKL